MFRTTILVLFGLVVAPCFPALAKQEQPPASQKQMALITGLDGGTYEAYLPKVVERVQTALRKDNLYNGAINGKLDHDTMEVIAEFQKEHGIMVNGVPSPYTRAELFGQSDAGTKG